MSQEGHVEFTGGILERYSIIRLCGTKVRFALFLNSIGVMISLANVTHLGVDRMGDTSSRNKSY